MKITSLALSAALVLAPAALLAQQTISTVPVNPSNPAVTGKSINERKVNQQERIGNGVKSGQLTAGETSKLEHQEAGINKEERGMRAQDNGHLTSGDKKLLTKQQNQESRRIRRDKHNGKVR